MDIVHSNHHVLTEAENAVWNWVAKHAPEDIPLTDTVWGFILRLSRMESWHQTLENSSRWLTTCRDIVFVIVHILIGKYSDTE